jgi:hypothetical protein
MRKHSASSPDPTGTNGERTVLFRRGTRPEILVLLTLTWGVYIMFGAVRDFQRLGHFDLFLALASVAIGWGPVVILYLVRLAARRAETKLVR